MLLLILGMKVVLVSRGSSEPGSPGNLIHSRPDPALPTPKRCDSGVRPASQTSFFLALGLVEFAAGVAWNFGLLSGALFVEGHME